MDLQYLLFFFFEFEHPNWGCGLSTGAAYTWTFMVFKGKEDQLKNHKNGKVQIICVLINKYSTHFLCFHHFKYFPKL